MDGIAFGRSWDRTRFLLTRIGASKLLIASLAVMAVASPNLSQPGLRLFRKAGRDGQSCAGCHSPDGIEIGAFGFTRRDVVRRASNHLNHADADLIATYLRHTPITRATRVPDTYRPLQPGGSPLPGATPAERDAAFGRELAHVVPELCGAPIRTTAVALQVRDRLLALDPRTVRVGIPFNRLSEDGYHGPQHATVADWIPDVQIGLTPPIVALQDKYLASPTPTNLAALSAAVSRIEPHSQFQQLAIAKYRSLLLMQDAIRHGGPGAARLDHIRLIGPGNPFWEVAEVGHHNDYGDTRMLDVPKAVLLKKQAIPMKIQMEQIRLPWYWAGWTIDPTLAHIDRGLSRTSVRGDYFTKYLWDDGPYPIHMAFMLSKKLVESGFGKREGPKGPPQHYEIQFSNFLLGDRLQADDPRWHAIKPEVFRIAANVFRLSLLLLEADIAQTGGCIRPESQLYEIDAMRRFFRGGGGDADDLALCDRVAGELKSARVDYR